MEYDVAIIGGGPAGYSAAESLMKAGKSVVLFEKENMGGVCLNEGCIPTKTLLFSAKLLEGAKLNSKYGIVTPEVSFDFSKIMGRKSKVVRKLVLGIKAKLKSPLIEIVNGEATICTPHLITCDEQAYPCKSLLLCMGSSTAIPPIDGLDQVDYWTHKEALSTKEVPASLLVMGGGVIGMELAAFYNAMGTAITVVEMLPEIVTGMDAELSALLRETYSKKGIKFLLSTKVTSVKSVGESV
ncbi:MAG: NAD(P)/FAD-dependent oxidoreductase, partial [Bacteroidaceae bacterium]|nr:NAD(P)/FAD-dependent oxidoreductase [Bacteroidaceae bacterium]